MEVLAAVSPASLAEVASRRCGGGCAEVESRWWEEESLTVLMARREGGKRVRG